uniref:Uncharacterized protein n=1 Tax=Salix viminalis TaxID=40686 RepID=A0A6N2KG49_SALVM
MVGMALNHTLAKPTIPKPDYNSNPKPYLPKPKMTVPEQSGGYGSKPYLANQPSPNQTLCSQNQKLTVPEPKYSYDPKPKLIVPKPDTGKPDMNMFPNRR